MGLHGLLEGQLYNFYLQLSSPNWVFWTFTAAINGYGMGHWWHDYFQSYTEALEDKLSQLSLYAPELTPSNLLTSRSQEEG
jgi:hypothetical protein